MNSVKTEKPRLSIIGLGKLGSPMAAVFGYKGFEVVGVDLNEAFVAAINSGLAPVQEPKLQELLDLATGRVRATTDYSDAILNTDVTFIIVPTPSGRDHLFSNKYLVDALAKIGHALRSKSDYHVVVVTSTVVPGSMDGELAGVLETASGRNIGHNLGFCYNPEFIALGSVVKNMLYPDMLLIGQSDDKAGAVLEQIYRSSTDSNPEYHRMNLVNAELCKISVNTFVTTKISYANMIADMCDHLPGADAYVVTRAVGADSRVGRKYLTPAIGYGGPCFPRDNKAFSALARRLGVNSALAEATDQINDHQLDRLQRAIEAVTPRHGTVAILGLSYKPDTGVIEESQGVQLAQWLAENGYKVFGSDPLALDATASVLQQTVQLVADATLAIASAEVVVVMTPWPEYAQIDPAHFAKGVRKTVIDPWGHIDVNAIAVVADVLRLGTGSWKSEQKLGVSSRTA